MTTKRYNNHLATPRHPHPQSLLLCSQMFPCERYVCTIHVYGGERETRPSPKTKLMSPITSSPPPSLSLHQRHFSLCTCRVFRVPLIRHAWQRHTADEIEMKEKKRVTSIRRGTTNDSNMNTQVILSLSLLLLPSLNELEKTEERERERDIVFCQFMPHLNP